jgi:hypothetical protein
MPTIRSIPKPSTFTNSLLLLTVLYYCGWLVGAFIGLYANTHLFRYSGWFGWGGDRWASINNACWATAVRTALPALGFGLAFGFLRRFAGRTRVSSGSLFLLSLLFGCIVTLARYSRLTDMEWSWDFRNSTNLLHMFIDLGILSPLAALFLSKNPTKVFLPSTRTRCLLRIAATLLTALLLMCWFASNHWAFIATRRGPFNLEFQTQRGALIMWRTPVDDPFPPPVSWRFSADISTYANTLLPGFLGFSWSRLAPGFLSATFPIAAPLLLSLLLTGCTWKKRPLTPTHSFEISLQEQPPNTTSSTSLKSLGQSP